jgi:hypothetical protein
MVAKPAILNNLWSAIFIFDADPWVIVTP